MRNLTALVVLLAACGSPSRETTTTTKSPRGEREHAMANCPSAVPGAKTTMSTIPSGVELTVTSPDPTAQQEIAERARAQESMGDPTSEAPEHTGLHAGPGSIGWCPIIHAWTTVRVDRIENGVRIRVIATDPSNVDALREETRARVDRIGPQARR